MQYLFSVLKGKIKIAGGAISHIGFGVLILGILISNAGQRVISENNFGVQFDGEGMDKTFQRENVRLIKNAPLPLGDYLVTYLGDTIEQGATYYELNFRKIDPETGKIKQDFNVRPYLLMDTKMQQLAPNPDTKHYLTYDVFTHVTSLPGEGSKNAPPTVKTDTIGIGDTLRFNTGYLLLSDVVRFTSNADSIGVMAKFDAVVGVAKEELTPRFVIRLADGTAQQGTAQATVGNVQVTFLGILPEQNKFVFTVTDATLNTDWIVIKSIIFPMINLVWIGTIVMAIGFFISMRKRIQDNKVSNKNA